MRALAVALLLMPLAPMAAEDERPLSAEAPAWLTADLVARTIDAARRGHAIDLTTSTEVQLASQFVGIRPGGWAFVDGNFCTLGFVFGEPGAYRLSSAGHCGFVGDPVLVLASPSLFLQAGTVSEKGVVFLPGGFQDPTGDWMLIDVLPQFQSVVDPDVAVVNGPDGPWTGTSSVLSPVPAKSFGHGLGVGAGGTPRAGLLLGMDADGMHALAMPANVGDSGAPVLTLEANGDGRAVGLVSTLKLSPLAGDLPRRAYVSVTPLSAIPATLAAGDGGVLD